MVKGDSLKVPLRFCIILFLLVGLSGFTTPANGQSGSVTIIGSPEVDQFPAVRFYMDVMDTDGNFVTNLQPADIQVMENGTPLAPQSVEMVENGLQLIIAINPSPALAVQTNGISEYQRQIQALMEWANAQPTQTPDDYSLSTPTGLFLIRARDPKKFGQALGEFTPDLTKTQPSLNSLSEALDLATDPLGRPLMKRSILYITTTLPPANTASLPDLAKRAQEIGVMINVWLVGPVEPAAAATTPDPLQQLAESTGGTFFRVLPNVPMPEIEPVFQPLRHTYAVQYQSAIQKGGAQSLSVKVKTPSSDFLSTELHFDLDVQPPNPMFLNPPNEVHRTWTAATKKEEEANLDPDSIALQILVEFPDAHPRQLKATRLYADGKLISENTAEPFDRFDWPINDLSASGRSLLKVEAVDSLDLTGTSVEVPVDVVVDVPIKTSLFDRLSERGLVAISAMVVAGAALALILAFTNTQRQARWKRQQVDKKLEKDPVTQPVLVQPVAPRQSRTGFWKKRESEPRPVPFWPRPTTPNAPARLVALDETEQPVTGGIIFLARQEITFGSDPKRATQVLNSPTVDGLHARLYRTPDDDFYLADQNSVAGTWINFAPVTAAGAHLEHGDLIHIGKVMFRFELTDPSQVPPLEVKVVNLEQPHDPQ
jgi:hypothetical protein